MTTSETSALEELHGWLKGAWDPDLTLRAWWARLAESGWSQPHWPAEWFGKGLPVAIANDATRAIQEYLCRTDRPECVWRALRRSGRARTRRSC